MLSSMKSVADTLRDDNDVVLAALSPDERMQLALQLGEESLRIYVASQGVDRASALRHFRSRTQLGRRRCRCLQDPVS